MNCIADLATDFQVWACHTLSTNNMRTSQVPLRSLNTLLTPLCDLESTVGLHLKKVSVRRVAKAIFFDLFF